MQNITNQIHSLLEFDNHHQVHRIENTNLGVVGFIATHSKRGLFPSLGATRVWNYTTETEAVQDALRLSRLMSHKSIFAHLPYGGGKATLMINDNRMPDRKELFLWYTSQVNELNGAFITGSDVGVHESDVNFMQTLSPFIIGSDVPAAYYTAYGVLQGIEVALEKLYGTTDITGKHFAVQGLGKVGYELVSLLYEKAGSIVATDVNRERITEILKIFPRVKIVDPEEIYKEPVDVFAPCALSYSINSQTIDRLKCRAIIGSANNQIENENISQLLFKKGVLYGVDYIVNNGGFISVVDQYQHGTHNDTRIKEKILLSKASLKNLLEESSARDLSPNITANQYVASVLNTNYVYDAI